MRGANNVLIGIITKEEISTVEKESLWGRSNRWDSEYK